MTENESPFERLEHRVFGGDTLSIPLYVDPEHDLNELSQGLLYAATLIGGNLNKFDGKIENLVDEVGKIVTGVGGSEGLIIEDEGAGGAINLDAEVTKVMLRGKGNWAVPTQLFFDMIFAWSEYEK